MFLAPNSCWICHTGRTPLAPIFPQLRDSNGHDHCGELCPSLDLHIKGDQLQQYIWRVPNLSVVPCFVHKRCSCKPCRHFSFLPRMLSPAVWTSGPWPFRHTLISSRCTRFRWNLPVKSPRTRRSASCKGGCICRPSRPLSSASRPFEPIPGSQLHPPVSHPPSLDRSQV